MKKFQWNLEKFWKTCWILNFFLYQNVCFTLNFNPQAPVAQKSADEVVFDISKVKESSSLNLTSLTPHQIFDAHLLETTDLSPSRFHFSVGFISRSCFESDGFIAYSNKWDCSKKEDRLMTLKNDIVMVKKSISSLILSRVFFLNRTSLTLPSDFCCASFGNYRFKPF